MQAKRLIEVFETFSTGEIRIIESGLENSPKINKLISKISLFKAKHGVSNYSWRFVN